MYEVVGGQTLPNAHASFMEKVCQEILAADPEAFAGLDPAVVRATLTASLAGHDSPLLPAGTTEPQPSLQSIRFTDCKLTGAEFVLGDKKFAPWPHQLLTIRSIVFQILNGQKQFLLADSVGGGKTAQAVGVFFELKKLGLMDTVVIYAPKPTIPDWQETVAHFSQEEEVVVIDKLKDFDDLKAESKIVIVRQNMQVKPPQAQQLKKLLQSALLIADESPNLSAALRGTIPDHVVRLNLSGTAVTNTFHDIVPFAIENFYEDRAKQAASDLSEVFSSRLAVAAFRSKIESGQGFIAYLNLLSSMMDATFMRTRAALDLNIPEFDINSHTLGQAADALAITERNKLSQLMTKGGANVALSAQDRKAFNCSLSINEKHIAYAADALKTAPNGSGILFVCALGKDVNKLREQLAVLAPEHNVYKIANKSERGKIRASAVDRAVAVISAAKDVEGFNIQKNFPEGLLRVVFLGGVSNASDFEQGVGRPVRPLPKPLGRKVQVDIVVDDDEKGKVVERIVYGTIKGKQLLALALLAPSQAFLSVAKATIDGGYERQLRYVTSEKELFNEIEMALHGVQEELNKEFSLSGAEIKQKILQGCLLAQRHPFILSNLKRFHFDPRLDGRFVWLQTAVRDSLLPKYIVALNDMDLPGLLAKPVLKLVCQIGALREYIALLDKAIGSVNIKSYITRYCYSMAEAFVSSLQTYLSQPSFKFALGPDIAKFHARAEAMSKSLQDYQAQLQEEERRQAEEQRRAEHLRLLQEQQRFAEEQKRLAEESQHAQPQQQSLLLPKKEMPVDSLLGCGAAAGEKPLDPFAGIRLGEFDPFAEINSDELNLFAGLTLPAGVSAGFNPTGFSQSGVSAGFNPTGFSRLPDAPLPPPFGSTADMMKELGVATTRQMSEESPRRRRNFSEVHPEKREGFGAEAKRFARSSSPVDKATKYDCS